MQLDNIDSYLRYFARSVVEAGDFTQGLQRSFVMFLDNNLSQLLVNTTGGLADAVADELHRYRQQVNAIYSCQFALEQPYKKLFKYLTLSK